MNKEDVIRIFVDQLKIFINEILVILPHRVEISLIYDFVQNEIGFENLLEKMEKNLTPEVEKKISQRKKEGLMIFGDLEIDSIINEILRTSSVQIFWEWIDLFVKITKKYKSLGKREKES